MTDAQFKDLDRFVSYAEKQFQLPLLAGCLADGRADPEDHSRAVGLSLLLGEVIQSPGLSQLEEETKLPQWQRWVGYHDCIRSGTPTVMGHEFSGEVAERGAKTPKSLKVGTRVVSFPMVRAHGGDKHGPFYYLTQCLAVGKINKFLLKTPAQQQAARSAIEHYRQLQEHLEELSQINAELLRREEPLRND